MSCHAHAVAFGLLLGALSLPAQVVINEIFYNAPNNQEELQWIELHNAGDKAVDLASWKLAKGVKFTFPANSTLAPHGYAVVCRGKEQFAEHYTLTVAGEFKKGLKKSGEQIDLRDAAGNVVDSVTFADAAPWPLGADGTGSSLERICPAAKTDLAQNWAASKRPEDAGNPGGTPGERNSVFAENLPPVIDQVTATPQFAKPGEAIAVKARIQADPKLREATLVYQVVGKGAQAEEQSIPLTAGATQMYTASIPGQGNGQIIRFHLRAVDEKGAVRLYPAENEPHANLSVLSQKLPEPGTIPLALIFRTSQHARPEPMNNGPMVMDMQMRMQQMALSQFQSFLNLAPLWISLTTQGADAENVAKLRPIFMEKSAERDRLEEAVRNSTNYIESVRTTPVQVAAFKKSLSEAVKPLLNAEQSKAFDTWNSARPRGDMFSPGPFGGPQGMGSLENEYLFWSTQKSVTREQFPKIWEIYRDALNSRDKVDRQPEQNNPGRIMIAPDKSAAQRAQVNQKLKAVLTPEQNRLFAQRNGGVAPTRRQQPRPGEQGMPGAFVYIDPKTRVPQLFDEIELTHRHGGYKVHFNKGELLEGMPVVNVSFKEESDRWSLTEPFSYELHRRAGETVCRMDYARMYLDGTPQGYCLFFEQPNKAFFRRMGINEDGNLYKGTYRGDGLEGTNVKKSDTPGGHEDLAELVGQLERAKNDTAAQWEIIRREFDAEKLASHYAVRILLSDWDGFFNNYYLYHDVKGTKKWTLYVWDQDKTWGDFDFNNRRPLIDLPLTYGAEGDKPPGWQGDEPPQGFHMGGGGAMWWRPGGVVSKPVLANSVFRKHFLARIKDLLDKEFTPERLNPLFEQQAARLKEEVRLRAEARNENADQALEAFERNITSFKDFVVKRRNWLLAQKEIQAAPPWDPAQLK